MGAYDVAEAYWHAGLSPIPLRPSAKRPILREWQRFCESPPPLDTVQQWIKDYANANIGLALGTKIGKMRLVAIDIDDDRAIKPVADATGIDLTRYPSKTGKKGVTIFVLAGEEVRNLKLKLQLDGKKQSPAVEFLCVGSQTVIPPSKHPDGPEYVWNGVDLLSFGVDKLHHIYRCTLDEVAAFCTGDYEHFQNLNEMVWKGLDRGGNTHDCCVSAVACMVARGWSDVDIHRRIERAKREACERAGDHYDWPNSTEVIQEWIDSARLKGMEGESLETKEIGGRKAPKERTTATWIIGQLGGLDQIACVNGVLRNYRDGHWPDINIPEILRQCYFRDSHLREREAKSAVSIVHTMCDRQVFGFTPGIDPKYDPMRQRICLMNGTINVVTGALERWDPDHQLLHQLNTEWNEEATCPLWERVLHETLDGDEKAINLFEEFCALTLIDDMSYQKLLFLKGPGGNGKGTLARVLRFMHDPNAVSSVGITELNDERKRTSLVGKLINISGEQSRLNLVSDTYLKKITGGDPIDVRRLYGEVQNNIMLSVRFLELVNEMPATSDSSYALRRRIMILPCPNVVRNPDKDLDKKLWGERQGILVRWVEALRRLRDRGDFEIPDSSKYEVDRYMIENDPVHYWLENQCTASEERPTESTVLYVDFREWLTNMGFRYPVTEIQWGKRIKGLGYEAYQKRVGKRNVRVRNLRLNHHLEV